MSGAPISGIPQSVVGAVEQRRRPGATKDTSNLQSYVAYENYYEINLATDNILEKNGSNTLRFQNSTYQIFFGAVHAGIWSDSLQVSLVFQDDSQNFFHICIPVQLSGTVENENAFLASWLGRAPAPQGLTLNELLNFRGSESDVRFATLEYCLKYNVNKNTDGSETSTLKPYAFCIFNTALQIRSSSVPAWLSSDPRLTNGQTIPAPGAQGTYRRKTFDEIFNYMMHGRIHQFIYSNPDPYLIGAETHFASGTQNVILPAYFKVNSSSLSRIAYSAAQLKQGVRGLHNVKCYPIDLASQVDDGGNIYIDNTKNTPINVNEVLNKTSVDSSANVTQATQDALNAQIAAAQNISTIRYWLIISICILFALAIIVVLVVYFMPGRGTPPAVVSNTTASSAVNPVVDPVVDPVVGSDVSSGIHAESSAIVPPVRTAGATGLTMAAAAKAAAAAATAAATAAAAGTGLSNP